MQKHCDTNTSVATNESSEREKACVQEAAAGICLFLHAPPAARAPQHPQRCVQVPGEVSMHAFYIFIFPEVMLQRGKARRSSAASVERQTARGTVRSRRQGCACTSFATGDPGKRGDQGKSFQHS